MKAITYTGIDSARAVIMTSHSEPVTAEPDAILWPESVPCGSKFVLLDANNAVVGATGTATVNAEEGLWEGVTINLPPTATDKMTLVCFRTYDMPKPKIDDLSTARPAAEAACVAYSDFDTIPIVTDGSL